MLKRKLRCCFILLLSKHNPNHKYIFNFVCGTHHTYCSNLLWTFSSGLNAAKEQFLASITIIFKQYTFCLYLWINCIKSDHNKRQNADRRELWCYSQSPVRCGCVCFLRLVIAHRSATETQRSDYETIAIAPDVLPEPSGLTGGFAVADSGHHGAAGRTEATARRRWRPLPVACAGLAGCYESAVSTDRPRAAPPSGKATTRTCFGLLAEKSW